MANNKLTTKTTDKSVAAKKKSFLQKSVATFVKQGNYNQRVAEKAYELYLQRGAAHGNDLNDWFEAEKIVASENP